MSKSNGGPVASCHCGAVEIAFAAAPTEVTECNCSLCRRWGVPWVYGDADEFVVSAADDAADTYAWNGRHVDFHRCATCGCVTHWVPRDGGRSDRGVNARLLPPDILAAARVRHKDGADTGKYLD